MANRSAPSSRRLWPAALSALVVSGAVGIGIGAFLGSRQSVATDLRLDGPSSSAAVTTTTAVPLEVPTTSMPDTSVVPDTTVAPTTARPVPTTVDRPGPIDLGASGTELALPADDDRRLVASPDDCAAFAASGTAIDCGRFTSRGVAVVWVRDADGSIDVLTRDPSVPEGDVWVVRLTGDADGIGENPQASDVSGDGEADLVIGRRRGDDLVVDVVEVGGGEPRVTLHLDLPGGRARVAGGELLAWTPVGDGRLAQYSLSASSGAWGISSREFVDAAAVAPSQF